VDDSGQPEGRKTGQSQRLMRKPPPVVNTSQADLRRFRSRADQFAATKSI
jgi:hypothetical protein